MDASRFDRLTRSLGSFQSRRTVLGGMLAGALLFREAAAGDKHKNKDNNKKRKRKKRNQTCWRNGNCLPRIGANLSRCNLEGSTAFNGLNCTGCNVSRANLRGIQARGANFAIANLSGSCLVDADFTGATFAPTTNLTNAIFCRTTMPDGSVNNTDCGVSTDCCKALCVPATCQGLGKTCGTWADGCGNTLNCGTCGTGATPSCNDGTCATCAATCGANCFVCYNLTNGTTTCGRTSNLSCGNPCTTNADCPSNFPLCVSTFSQRNSSRTDSAPRLCRGATSPGICFVVEPC